MSKSRSLTIFYILILFIYFLLSQFYLRPLGSEYVYIINPAFFIVFAFIIKTTIEPVFKTDKYKKTITQYVLITMLTYAVVYLISGIFLSYGQNPYSRTFRGIILNLYSTGTIIVCKEFIRYRLINNVYKQDRKITFILIVITFSLYDISLLSLANSINIYYFSKIVFSKWAPSLIKNGLFTFIALYTDNTPSVIYQLLWALLQWIPPVLPNAPWVYYAITDVLFPLILLFYCTYEVASKDKMHLYKISHPTKPGGLIPVAIAVVSVIWFTLGVFPIKPLGVASGSMKPTLYVGDLVLVRKCNSNDIKVNDIIEYKRKEFTVIHRVIEKYQEDGHTFFITKGDNNGGKDNDPVSEDDLKGKIIARIPYLAWPTLWLERLSGRQSYVDVETGN